MGWPVLSGHIHTCNCMNYCVNRKNSMRSSVSIFHYYADWKSSRNSSLLINCSCKWTFRQPVRQICHPNYPKVCPPYADRPHVFALGMEKHSHCPYDKTEMLCELWFSQYISCWNSLRKQKLLNMSPVISTTFSQTTSNNQYYMHSFHVIR